MMVLAVLILSLPPGHASRPCNGAHWLRPCKDPHLSRHGNGAHLSRPHSSTQLSQLRNSTQLSRPRISGVPPPWVLGEIEWPKCCKNMGLWIAVAFCEEQQLRLKRNEEGELWESVNATAVTKPGPCKGKDSPFGASSVTFAISMSVTVNVGAPNSQSGSSLNSQSASLLSRNLNPIKRVLPTSLPPDLVKICLAHYDINSSGNFEYGELISVAQELRNEIAVPFRFQEHLRRTVVAAGAGTKAILTPAQFSAWITKLLQGGDKDVFEQVQ